MEGVKRILVIDDTGVIGASVAAALTDQPGLMVVGVARGAQDALEMVETMRPHVVLMDVRMPYIDGSTLLGALQAYPVPDKILLSTNNVLSPVARMRLTALGADTVLDRGDIAGERGALVAALQRTRRSAIDGASEAKRSNVVFAADRFPIPSDELVRARAVGEMGIANLDVDPRLNILVRHMARSTGFPVAAVNVIGSDQLWVKAGVGIGLQTLPRGDSICAHAICSEGVTAISDLNAVQNLRDLPVVVGSMQLRAYVGAPIIARSGARLGMACIADTKPRVATRAVRDIVSETAVLIAAALESAIPQMRRVA